MRLHPILFLSLVCLPFTLSAQTSDMEQQFIQLSRRFEARDNALVQDLKAYLKQYPYSTYEDEVRFMTGVIYAERNACKQSTKELSQVEGKRLSRDHQLMLTFYRAYNNTMTDECERALVQYNTLLDNPTYGPAARYGSGYCLYRLARYDEALPVLLEQSQQKAVPYFLTQIYYHNRQQDSVLTRATRLLSDTLMVKDPDYQSELHRMLGEIYYFQKQYPQAIDHLKLIRNHKDAITEQDYFLLANAYAELGNIEQAKLSYQASMQIGLTPAIQEEVAYNYTLSTARTSTAIGESVEAFRDFLKRYPQSKHQSEIFHLMSRAFLQSKNYKSALALLDSIPHPNDEMLLTKQFLRYQLGVDAYAQSKMNQAVQWMTAVLESPNGPQYQTEAYYFRAEAYYQLRNYLSAEQDISAFIHSKSAPQSPNYIAGLYLYAYTAFNLQHYTDARQRFTTYTQQPVHDPAAYADAYNRLGDCAFHARDFNTAISYYQKAAAGNQAASTPYALFQQGYAEGLLHHYDRKIDILHTLVTRYPKSDYCAEALYQIARAYIQQSDNPHALTTYQQLITNYPRATQARPAHLEIAMLYRNQGDYDNAIRSYQKTIQQYPAGEEAYAALNALENIYVELNKVEEYLAYTKTLEPLHLKVVAKEDSLSFAAAELQFMTGKAAEALPHYVALAARTGSRYQLPATAKAAQIYLEQQSYEAALPLFEQYLALAPSSVEREQALSGMLTCAQSLKNEERIITITSRLISEGASPALMEKAHFLRGVAYANQQAYEKALVDLQPLTTNVVTSQGAQAQYLVAYAYTQLGDIDEAEQQIIAFTQQKTQQQYWLAKALILLSDIYRLRGDDFQAQQYLLSLQNNYKQTSDDIQTIVADKLSQIE